MRASVVAPGETDNPDNGRMPDAKADPLIVAISSRTLFAMEDSHELFEREGIQAYADFQRAHENDLLSPGVAFPLVRKLLALNDGAPPEAPRVEVILISRNSADVGLRIFNSIAHHGLAIKRAAFSNGAPPYPYIRPFGADLFLSTHGEDVRSALAAGVADRNRSALNGRMYGYGGAPLLKAARLIASP